MSCCSLFHWAEGFSSSSGIPKHRVGGLSGLSKPSPKIILYALEDDEDDDDEEIDDSNLGDWRKFRATLIDGGLPSEPSSSSSGDKKTTTAKPKVTSKSVASKNEALLEEQNEELAKEYRTGVWAHTIGQPEVGSLLCRMPIEAEIYHQDTGYWKDKLDIMLNLNNEEGDEFGLKATIDEDTEQLNDVKVNQ